MRRFIRELPREWWVAGTLAVLLIALAIVAPRFFQRRQLLSIATATVPLLVTASGMALVIISRQIDISVGSQFALCSILLGTLTQAHWPIVLAAVVAIFAGACFGALNGLLVAGLGLPSIVVTLATMVIGREGLRWWREGEFVRDLPADFQWLGFSQADGQNLILLLATILFLSLAAATRYLSAGRFLYAVGSDFEAARLAGLRPRRVTLFAFIIAGGLTGSAALLNAVRFTDVDPKTGTGMELSAIAAAVLGGVSISGGRGNLFGVLFAVLLLGCIGPALVFFGWPAQWEKAVQGGIILIAVAADGWRRRRGEMISDGEYPLKIEIEH